MVEAAAVGQHLRRHGATEVWERAVGGDQVLVYGQPFDVATAVRVAADLRARGWPADVRPVGGGHLAAWQSHTRPVVVADRLWVCFPWSEFDRGEADLLVEIDPGRAFGTGAHPTTRLLLAELVARLHGGESVLDVGCGSGVLAIAAARLGAAHVTAIDIEPEAIAATQANAARNHLDHLVTARDTPIEHITGGPYDVIVANIHAAPLIEMAPAIQRCLAPDGWLALSGLSPAQLDKVKAGYNKLTAFEATAEEDWSALVAAKTGPAEPIPNEDACK